MSSARAHAAQQRSEARPVTKPSDRNEREAERAGDVVARGGTVAGWSFTKVPTMPVQRQEVVKEKSDDEKKKEALSKAGEAALETPQGKAVKEKVLADPLVKTVKDAVTSTPGLIATGAVAAGGVAALGAAKKPLPFQPPAIPLDKITPGLSAQVKYEGPVNAPTFVGLTLTYKEQGPKGKPSSKSDDIAKETAALKAQQEMFKPGSQKAAEKAEADEFVQAYIRSQKFTIPLTPGAPAGKEEDAPKKEDEPVQRAPASGTGRAPAHAHVDGALSTPARPLEAPARRAMEARFGYDFSKVRVHDDTRAAATAATIDAAAFTVGRDVVFGAGRYDPRGGAGKRLLAHELAHVAQQEELPRKAAGQPLPLSTRRDLESRFGEPLDDVRVHTGAEGGRVAGTHSALAVAKGSDVFFAAGAWAPGTEHGNRLLRHEIAHLLQARRPGRAWPEGVLEAEAQLAARAPGTFGVRGRAAPGQPLLVKTYVSTVGGSKGYLEAAVKFYKLWENETATRIDSYQSVVDDLATDTTPVTQFRIVAHGNKYNLFLPLLTGGGGTDYADLNALGLQTQQQLAAELGKRAHVTSDETDRVFNWLSTDKEAAPLLKRLALTAKPTGMLQEFVWWVVDEHWAANAKESGTGTPSSAADRTNLQARVSESQEAVKTIAAAGLPATASKSDLDELRTRTLGAFAKAGWTWPAAPGDIKEKLGRFSQQDTGQILREVKAGTFEGKLQKVKKRVSTKTYIEIRGCNVGQNDDYLNGMRAFFGTKPSNLPSISAPMLYQFFGTPGALAVPEGGRRTPPVAESLKFLFEETFDDKSAAADVQKAVRTARLTTVGGLVDVLRFADIKAEFEKWWQMKQAAAGTKAPIASATLKDFQDFLTTAPRTFPVNAPGIAPESLWFLILIPSTAIPALMAWVKDQGYTLPGGEDLTKHFFAGSTRWDPAKFAKAQSELFVDWLGDDYPVPKNIYFPESPEYKKNFRKLP